MSDENYDIDVGDSGASKTVSTEAGQIRKGGYIMIKGKPCKVKDVSVSKTGKHGHAKCKFAEFPPDVKDINEYMLKVGKDQLQWFINEGLQDYPIEGVYTLNDIPEPSPPKIWNPQFDGWDNKVMLGAGMLSVFTGYPGHGKTTFLVNLLASLVKGGYKVAMFNRELPNSEVIKKLICIENPRLNYRDVRKGIVDKSNIGFIEELKKASRKIADIYGEDRFIMFFVPSIPTFLIKRSLCGFLSLTVVPTSVIPAK